MIEVEMQRIKELIGKAANCLQLSTASERHRLPHHLLTLLSWISRSPRALIKITVGLFVREKGHFQLWLRGLSPSRLTILNIQIAANKVYLHREGWRRILNDEEFDKNLSSRQNELGSVLYLPASSKSRDQKKVPENIVNLRSWVQLSLLSRIRFKGSIQSSYDYKSWSHSRSSEVLKRGSSRYMRAMASGRA